MFFNTFCGAVGSYSEEEETESAPPKIIPFLGNAPSHGSRHVTQRRAHRISRNLSPFPEKLNQHSENENSHHILFVIREKTFFYIWSKEEVKEKYRRTKTDRQNVKFNEPSPATEYEQQIPTDTSCL